MFFSMFFITVALHDSWLKLISLLLGLILHHLGYNSFPLIGCPSEGLNCRWVELLCGQLLLIFNLSTLYCTNSVNMTENKVKRY